VRLPANRTPPVLPPKEIAYRIMRWPLKQYLVRHARTVHASMCNPLEAQSDVFDHLKRLLRGSEIASQTGFDQCRSLEDCRHLPSSDGDSMKPLFTRAFERGVAESGLFGHSKIVGFGRTSGTLGEPKDIPLNEAYLKSLDRSLIRMTASHLYSTGEWNTFLTGKRILLGSRPLFGVSPTGLPISDISGLLPTRSWTLLRSLYIPRYEDLWIQDWQTKAELLLEQAYGHNVISITGIPALAMDFAERARAKYNVTHLNHLWPNLRLYIFGGVPLSQEQKNAILRAWFDSDHTLHFVETYFATEGALAFSFDPKDDGLALNCLEHLYLFLPDSGDGSFLFSHELREGHVYSIHITTPGGLINYRMDDRVIVVSTRPLRIRIVGRERDEISMTGERLTLEQLDLALDAVGLNSARFGYHCPVIWMEAGDKPHLVWGIPAMAGDFPNESWAARLDEALCHLNILYAEALVHEKVISESRLVSVPTSVLERYRNTKLGVGQFKPTRLFNSRADFAAMYRWQP
jgi:GH3 auxin-responsive promoter